jgi:glycosyltransferase involved in cell wall biosynthesis
VISIARIEPENSILQFARGAANLPASFRCVVLGKLDDSNSYHREVRAAGGDTVLFPGAIYDHQVIHALRFYARAYLHGHRVGGTNPSLVEALGAGSAVLAHDNRFNRWVAGEAQLYFSTDDECARQMIELCVNDKRIAGARIAARARHKDEFQWPGVLSKYESTLEAQLAHVN